MRADKSERLQNTNEKIHPSARVRLSVPNARGISDHGVYQCEALKGWVTRRSGDGSGRFEWVYGAGDGELVLEEAALGAVERELLGRVGGGNMVAVVDGTGEQ
jgi:hypothetical protein